MMKRGALLALATAIMIPQAAMATENLTVKEAPAGDLQPALSTAAPVTQWQKTFGTAGFEAGYSIKQTPDGGYIMTGALKGTTNGLHLLKMDASGNKVWERSYGLANATGTSVELTSDGGYIVAGRTVNPAIDLYLLKTDANGNVQWEKRYGGAKEDQGFTVKQTADGGYVALGESNSFNTNGTNDLYIVKTDASGTLQWQTTHDSNGMDHSGQTDSSLQQTSDGGYILTGSGTTGALGSLPSLYLIKLQSTGAVQWKKTFSTSGLPMEGHSVQQTTDGGFIVGGNKGPTPLLLKTDSAGNATWSYTYGGGLAGSIRSVQQAGDMYIAAGDMNASGAMFPEAMLLSASATGGQNWVQTYGGSNIDLFMGLHLTNDGGAIAIGKTHSMGAGSSDEYVVKVK